MGVAKNEELHLCPVCNVVEMEFVERLESNNHMRMRRFKCPVCDHTEMYLMGGPMDDRRVDAQKDLIKKQKAYQYAKRKNLL